MTLEQHLQNLGKWYHGTFLTGDSLAPTWATWATGSLGTGAAALSNGLPASYVALVTVISSIPVGYVAWAVQSGYDSLCDRRQT